MLLEGYSNAEIAKRFDVSEDTAKVYVRTIAKKYGEYTCADSDGYPKSSTVSKTTST